MALRPFLALPGANVSEPADPIRVLAGRMQLHGLSQEEAEMAIAQWTTEGRRQS